MNSILIENPSENNKNNPPTKKSDSILLDGVSHSQFQPVFTQFLKGTELIGRVSETLMKKFGDTYVDPGLNKSSDKSAIDQSQEKFGLKNQIKSDRQVSVLIQDTYDIKLSHMYIRRNLIDKSYILVNNILIKKIWG